MDNIKSDHQFDLERNTQKNCCQRQKAKLRNWINYNNWTLRKQIVILLLGWFTLSLGLYTLLLEYIWGSFYLDLYQSQINKGFMRAEFDSRALIISESMSATWN